MAFRLKRHRKRRKKLSKKELLLKKLALIKKRFEKNAKKIKSKKLNNKEINDNNQIAVSIYKGDSDLTDLNMGHLQSAAGSYRKGRIDNRKK
jgi:hypothetical protein